MKKNNKINEDINADKTTVILNKKDLGDSSVQQNIQKLGKDVNVSIVDEDVLAGGIEPQDDATIKYLSQVKDQKTGQISKPFSIDSKKYQMVRGRTPDNKVVMGVLCFDELNESGENVIHSVEAFERNVALPMLERDGKSLDEVSGYDYARDEVEYNDKQDFIDWVNLKDVAGYKHFFINIGNGDVTAKFKNTKEMMKSGVKLVQEEDYMDAEGLRRFRFGEYFKSPNNEVASEGVSEGVDTDKLKTDVSKFVKLIKDKFSQAFAKLNTDIEKAQFIDSMAKEVGVPLSKLTQIKSSLSSISKDEEPVVENKKFTKNNLIDIVKQEKNEKKL